MYEVNFCNYVKRFYLKRIVTSIRIDRIALNRFKTAETLYTGNAIAGYQLHVILIYLVSLNFMYYITYYLPSYMFVLFVLSSLSLSLSLFLSLYGYELLSS